MIRDHVSWSVELAGLIGEEPDFEIVTDPFLSLFTFRHVPEGVADLDAHNIELVNAINNDGRIFLTQTNVDGRIAIRFQVGSTDTTRDYVLGALVVIRDCASRVGR